MNKIDEDIFSLIPTIQKIQRTKLRPIFILIFVSSLFLGVVSYEILIHFIAPNKSILKLFSISQEKYVFYSGVENGFYNIIGKAIEENMGKNDKIKFEIEATNGANSNLDKVSNSSKAFGIIQQDTLKTNLIDELFYKKRIKLITPLFKERLHVLYIDKDEKKEKLIQKIPNEHTKSLFADAKISTGPLPSGTNEYASAILEICKLNVKSQIFNSDFNTSIEKLLNESSNDESKNGVDKLDVVFFMSGAPLKAVVDALKTTDKHMNPVKLMGIDVSGIDFELKNKFNLSQFSGSFEGIYESTGVNTVGTYAWLIASNDVPDTVIIKLLEILKSLKELGKQENHGGINYSKSIEDFNDLLSEKKNNSNKDKFGTFIYICLNAYLFILLITVFVSKWKHYKYIYKINEVYQTSIPDVSSNISDITDSSSERTVDKLKHILKCTSEKLTEGTIELINLENVIRNDYYSGKLTIKDMNFLMKNLMEMRETFAHLSQNINYFIEKDIGIDKLKQFILSAYTSSSLPEESYTFLTQKIKN